MKSIVLCSLSLSVCLVGQSDETAGEELWNESAKELSASFGVGYKQNVLYSEIAPKDSKFSYANFDGYAKGELVGLGAAWSLMGSGDVRHFTDVDNVPDETFIIALGKFSKSVGLFSELTAGTRYLYISQAFDATFDILDERTAVLRAQEPELFLEWRSLLWEFEYAFNVSSARMYFKDSANDFETDSLEFELNYELTEKSLITLTLEGSERAYTDLEARSAVGLPISDSLREMDILSVELEWERRFSLANWVGDYGIEIEFSERRDPAFGYYDRDRKKVGLEWALKSHAWSFDLDVGYSESDYLVQIVEDGDLRSSESWISSLQIERRLNEAWSAFINLDLEVEDSNETFFSYDSNSILFGFRLQ